MLQGEKLKYFYDYVSEILGEPVWTHEFYIRADEIKEKSKIDFIRLCAEAETIKMYGKDVLCWIPVTERLPEENAPCIVYNKYYGPMVGWRVDGERFRIPGARFPDRPTHWMPLPQPPKEEQ